MRRMKIELRGNLILLALNHLAVKFDQFTAGSTDQVIVMLMIEMMLVAAAPVAKPLLPGQSALTEEFQRPIYCRETDSRVLSFDEMIKILGAQMAFRLQKDEQNQLALASLLEPCPPQMLKKYIFLLLKLFHRSQCCP